MQACTPLPRYGLIIKSDACYSGAWAYEANRSGYEITVESACGPYTTALDRIYAKGFFQNNRVYKHQVSKRGAVRYQNHRIKPIMGRTDFWTIFSTQYHAEKTIEKTAFITTQTFSSDSATLVMSQMPWTGQTYKMGGWKAVKTFISKKWHEGYQLTSLKYTYFNQWWSVVVTKGSDVHSDGWCLRTNLSELKAAIKEVWRKKKNIIDITYGQGMWLLLSGKTGQFGHQAWKAADQWSVIEDFIQKQFHKKRYLTALTRGGERNTWFAVMSKSSQLTSQKCHWVSTDDFYAKKKEAWDEGYAISNIWDDKDFDNKPRDRYFVIWSRFHYGSQGRLLPDQSMWQTYAWDLQLSVD